jgi:hypothetical protein
MRTTLLYLAACAAALFFLHHAAVLRSHAPSVDAINAIVGDASFREAFGRDPDAATDSEDLRIRTHLAYVLRQLRAVPSDAVPAELRAARSLNLARLERYIARGEFPRNPASVRGRAPNFLDASGRICAVGDLVREDLGPSAVEAINARYQFARIEEMESSVLAAWQQASGLTVRELASIQPAYLSPHDDVNEAVRATEIALGAGNLALATFNGIQSGKPERSAMLAIAGIGFGFAGFALSWHDDAELSALDAGAGAASVFLGMVQLARPRPVAPEESGLTRAKPRFRLSPLVKDGDGMLAVQVSF